MIPQERMRVTRSLGGDSLWRRTSRQADAWEAIGASRFMVRTIRFGIKDMPTKPFVNGQELGDIPQTRVDKEFAHADLEKGLATGLYEEVSRDYARACMSRGCMVSSAFTTWQGEGDSRKGRFVINLHRQSLHWPKGSVRMETLPSFALSLRKDDTLMSWDAKGGYRHMFLHPDMRDYFIFRYSGRYFRCVALPFGWGRSAMWFTKMMRVMVKHVRSKMGYRILPYIDDFLMAPSPDGTTATAEDCSRARTRMQALLDRLGIVRHETKGCWEGSRVIDHLGMRIDTSRMKVYITDAKITRVKRLAKKVICVAERNKRLVPLSILRAFCGVCVSLSLALPLARFYTRSLYSDMRAVEREEWRPSPVTAPRGELASPRRCQPDSGRRPERSSAERQHRTRFARPALPSISEGPSLLARARARRRARPAQSTERHLLARRCSRRGVRRDPWSQYGPWHAGFVGGSRFLERGGPRSVDHSARAARSEDPSASTLLRLRVRPARAQGSSPRGQPGSGGRAQLDGGGLTADDERAPQASRPLGVPRSTHRGPMDPDSRQQVRGPSLPHVGPGRRPSHGRAHRFNPGRVPPRRGRFCDAATQRAAAGAAQVSAGRAAPVVVGWSSATVGSSVRSSPVGRAQDTSRESTGSAPCSELASASLVRALDALGIKGDLPARRGRRSFARPTRANQPVLGLGTRNLGLRTAWKAGIATTVLHRAGAGQVTGGAEEAARLLQDYGWSSGTWTNRSSQLSRWLAFCDEEDRCPLPATEGDVLAYIGYLSLEGRVGATSLPQYVTAISRYHAHHNLPSPTLTPLVKALMTAYARHDNEGVVEPATRVGLSATKMRDVVQFGLASLTSEETHAAAMVLFAFLFQLRDVSVAAVRASDITWTSDYIQVHVTRRKGAPRQARRRPLLLQLLTSPVWAAESSPLSLLRKWRDTRPDNELFFQSQSGRPSLAAAVDLVVSRLGLTPPPDCYYSSHSPRIGGFNELLCLQFSRMWIMQRLDWTAENMFSVYYDSRISTTAASHWFFGHMRPTASNRLQ